MRRTRIQCRNISGYLPRDAIASEIATLREPSPQPRCEFRLPAAEMLAAIEVACSLDAAGTALDHPLEVIDYLAEVPTDFGISTVGSRALCGSLLPEHLERTNTDGQSLGEAIESL